MASISKMITSAAQFSLEVAPALANFNFDFSLYKVEPPKEFEGVGSALSNIRREEAETGMHHVTARKLGALFEGLLPSTPRLTRAYGKRASEISQCSSITSQGRDSYGVFGSRIGADATSIWAAATSGQDAIAVHLLACLLAKIWEGPEATSIWVEIVKCRKQEIMSDFEKNDIAGLATLAASRQDVTRTQLREWDASARAWLRAADVVKARQQKQLMLIIDNLRAPVNRKSDTYQSVLSAWTDSLTKMEGLIQGISQKAQSGDILLALSAWHLFPDMMIVDPCVTTVQQNDQTFASGVVLTIGLEKTHSEHTGVFWSLPLAHLRHYGAPVLSVRSIDSGERSRISLDEFLQAYLGCFLQGWHDAGSDTLMSTRWLAYVSDLLRNSALCGSEEALLLSRSGTKFSWLNLLFLAANNFLNSSGNERLTANKLISLGRKYGKAFLGIPRDPVFGLLRHGAYVGLIQDEESRISCLRKIAGEMFPKMRVPGHQVFIRYKHTYPNRSTWVYEYATALPWPQKTLKRKLCDSNDTSQRHARWLHAGGNLKRVQDARYYDSLDKRFILRETSPGWDKFGSGSIQNDLENLRYAPSGHHPPDFGAIPTDPDFGAVPTDFDDWHRTRGSPELELKWSDRCKYSEEDVCAIRQNFEDRKKHYESQGEILFERDRESIEDFAAHKMGIFWDRSKLGDNSGPWYRRMYGDLESAALFITRGMEGLANAIFNPKQEFHELYALSESKKINAEALLSRLTSTFRMAKVEESDPHIKSLKAVSTTAMIYRRIPNSTIDIRVLQRQLWHAHWVPKLPLPPAVSLTKRLAISALEPYVLSRSESFACITMFESGQYDLDPDDLKNVMAMSSGNSLYISTALLQDPIEPDSGLIQGVTGNIGRPGIAFLVSPMDPLIKSVSMSEWPQIDRAIFDGEFRDSFASTSLHLSFTGANDSLNTEFTGAQDTEVYILETLISVYQRGKWIADIDPSRACLSVNLRRLPPCVGDSQCKPRTERSPATCIDNWLELIDAPEENVSLVRAHKNWQARLAATSISIQMGYNTVVLSDEVCPACLYSVRSSHFEKIVFIG